MVQLKKEGIIYIYTETSKITDIQFQFENKD